MGELTSRQNEILQYIKEFIATKGYPPTVREIGEALHLSSPATIHVHLNKLEERGAIRKSNNKNRAIEVLGQNEYIKQEPDNAVDVPLLGMITAGSPILAIERPNEYFSLPAYMIPNKKEVFALSVSGESMINAGILHGDIVIIERKNNANNGDIVAAMTDENEVTLKRFYKEKNHIRLQSENDYMTPIILENVTILGKAIGLYRKI